MTRDLVLVSKMSGTSLSGRLRSRRRRSTSSSRRCVGGRRKPEVRSSSVAFYRAPSVPRHEPRPYSCGRWRGRQSAVVICTAPSRLPVHSCISTAFGTRCGADVAVVAGRWHRRRCHGHARPCLAGGAPALGTTCPIAILSTRGCSYAPAGLCPLPSGRAAHAAPFRTFRAARCASRLGI